LDIEDRMQWSPWLAPNGVTVKVTNGVATLTGKAKSWFEYARATDYAYEGGAQQVFNNIEIH
jgi:osmotically-inducible protein OsmY